MKDPQGAVTTLLRDDPTVAGIVGVRVSAEVETPPCVQIISNATTRAPFGAGSARLGLQYALFFARCWGPDTPTGAILTRQLAGAVSDAVHLRGAYPGSTFLVRSYAPEINGLERDPETHWPYRDVRLEVYAAAQAVA